MQKGIKNPQRKYDINDILVSREFGGPAMQNDFGDWKKNSPPDKFVLTREIDEFLFPAAPNRRLNLTLVAVRRKPADTAIEQSQIKRRAFLR